MFLMFKPPGNETVFRKKIKRGALGHQSFLYLYEYNIQKSLIKLFFIISIIVLHSVHNYTIHRLNI